MPLLQRKLTVLALLLVGALACSSDPDPDEALVIDFEQENSQDSGIADAGNTSQDQADAASDAQPMTEDTSVADTREPDMPVEDTAPAGTQCQAKDAPIQLINTCTFEWGACADGKDYAFECNIQNLGGNVFSLCNCFENGVMDPADKIVDVCGLADWADVEAVVNEQCGWDLR